MKDNKTFVANIRCDYRHIAKIAKFLDSQEMFVGTKSKIASEAIRIIAEGIPEEFDVDGYLDAYQSLSILHYESEFYTNYKELNKKIKIERGRPDHSAAMKETNKRIAEDRAKAEHDENTAAARTLPKKRIYSPTEIEGFKSVLGPDEVLPEAKPEPEPETEPKPVPEPEDEPEQLKERTPADEEKDINRLRSGLAMPEGAPLADESETSGD